MSRGKGILSFIINAAIFILLEIAALTMLKHNNTLQNIWISKGAHAFMAKVWGGTEAVRGYFSLARQNEELAMENFRLSQQLRQIKEACSARQAFIDSCCTDGKTGKYTYIPASIMKVSNNSQHNYIIIGKGSEDGIVPKSGVITENGVIGIIDAVSRHFAYAISFKNENMVVSARIGEEGPTGSLVWDGYSSNGAILREIPHHIRTEAGDTVFTSGYSSIFPADIPIGVTSRYKIVNGATYEVSVELFEDFSALKYVTIVHNTMSGEIMELEKER